MALSKRERRLATLTGGLAAVILLPYLYYGVLRPAFVRRTQRNQLAAQVEEQRERLERAARTKKMVDEWNRRSLPRDSQAARSQYQNWLLDQVKAVKLQEAKVEASDHRPLGKIYDRLPFTVNGRGTVEQLTELLHRFYAAGHLHKIQRLTLKPQEKSDQLEIRLTIEALCLPGADRADQLTKLAGTRLGEPKLAPYVSSIAGRKVFSPYKRPETPRPREEPRPEEPPKPPSFDHADFLALTGIGALDGRPQAWFLIRTTGKAAKVFENEDFEIDKVRGHVGKIFDRAAEVQINGRLYRVELGQILKNAKLLAGGPPAGEKPSASDNKAPPPPDSAERPSAEQAAADGPPGPPGASSSRSGPPGESTASSDRDSSRRGPPRRDDSSRGNGSSRRSDSSGSRPGPAGRDDSPPDDFGPGGFGPGGFGPGF